MKGAADTMVITSEQCRLVRDSCERLREASGPVSLLFYGRLFELDPSARRLFHHDLARNGQKVIDMLGSVANALGNFDTMRGPLAALGRQHAEYGVRPEQYESVSAALLFAIGQTLGPDFDPPTRAAWAVALSAIAEAMKSGISAA